MRKFVTTVLFIFLTVSPGVTVAQEISTMVAQKQRRAGQVADRFVERFRQTLDFGITFKAFRVSDPSCTYRAAGSLSQNEYLRLKPSSRTVEKLYLAAMNYYYLKGVRDLSLVRIDAQSDSDESRPPKEIEAIEKGSKFFQDDDRKPQNLNELRELISTFDQLSTQYRKRMPRDAMKSPAWLANQKYLTTRSGVDHGGILNGNETFCVPKAIKVYIVDRGLFYFYVVEERGQMKVAGLGID